MNWTLPELMQFAGSYWGVCALHTGVKLNVFSQLEEKSLDAAAVAGLCDTDARATGLLLDALAALGLVTKSGELYDLTTFSRNHLVRSAPGYMGHIIMHHHHLMPSWAKLPDAVRSGGPVGVSSSHANDEETRESFLMGMFNLASQLAPLVAAKVDLTGRRRLLDLGGGPGTYAVHFCLQNPELSATIFDLPTSRSFAEGVVNRFGLSERINFAGGNFDHDDLPRGFDAVWISHILHSEDKDDCLTLLCKAVDALEPGGLLLVQDFLLNDEKDSPLFPALFSLNMLVGTPHGRSYSKGELGAMMTSAGLCDIRIVELNLPNGAGLLVGVKP
ncbi:MAG: methyltransferase domain-containing protein [Geobacteraceae bacterium]|nr:methyltransferase domain-containing protein [Geobacteraceae bacterium]